MMMFMKPWMRHGRRHHFFERGALKFVLLDLLQKAPRHGYDLIRELEEQSGGFYTPSPGTVYPTLQLLEDQGYIRGRESEGRKIYEVTPEGEAYLEEHAEHIRRHREHMAAAFGPAGRESAEVLFRMKSLFRDIAEASWQHREQPEKLARIREILERAKREIDDLGRE